MHKNVNKWLFCPFEYISVQKSLWIGIITMLLSGVVNGLTYSHFDGVIDFHTSNSGNYTFQFYFYQGFIDLVIFSLLLYISGLIFSHSSIRFIDVLSMQALARTPFLLTSVFTLLLPHSTVDYYLKSQILNGEGDIVVPVYQWIFFILHTILIITISVWVIILMYRAYSVACNLKGAKGVISFIAVLMVSEGIIKYLLYSIENYFLINE